MLLYYITDRKQLRNRDELLSRISDGAHAGIDYIQLREQDLTGRELENLAISAVKAVRDAKTGTKILVNSRSDIAIASGADGVHLRSEDISVGEVREIFSKAGVPEAIVAVSCHSIEEIALAAKDEANFVVFGPVFEKKGTGITPAGLNELKNSRFQVPVFALGGVSIDTTPECLASGAAGVAGIRLFQEGDITETVRRLREIG